MSGGLSLGCAGGDGETRTITGWFGLDVGFGDAVGLSDGESDGLIVGEGVGTIDGAVVGEGDWLGVGEGTGGAKASCVAT